MIQASELRIGSIINYRGLPNKVVGIISPRPDKNPHYDGKYLVEINPPDTILAPIEEISFETLTEEWLLKFGFKYQDRDVNRGDKTHERFYISPYFGDRKEFWLEIQTPKDSLFGNSFTWMHWDVGAGKRFIHLPNGQKLDYVHQLQNLYFSLARTDFK